MNDSSDSTCPARADLVRFIDAQQSVYEQALSELRLGRKQSHWMWFIFPQIAGLGRSGTSQYYALRGLDEARAYLSDTVLGARLLECTNVVITIEGRSALDIFGGIDEMKFRSSMTLFSHVAGPESIFQQVLDKYFAGEEDHRTLKILDSL
jgi:uncharacterized protein (DUF1810 family)